MTNLLPFLILVFLNNYFALTCKNISFIIITQNNNYNSKLATNLEQDIRDQHNKLKLHVPKIYVSNKDFSVIADWTIKPLIPPLLEFSGKDTQCVLLLEDRTNISVSRLLQGLENYNVEEEIWIGHALHDTDATIIHHFAFHEDPTFFKYPYLGAGMVISIPLLKRLKKRIIENDFKKIDFHIDASHEFALFVYNDGKGPMITHDDMFCSKEEPRCATYPKIFNPCGKSDLSSIYFAVKTCKKYHNDRLKVVQRTWGSYPVKITFFSDYEDVTFPTISLNIKNTEHGHCEKTMAILKYTEKEFIGNKNLKWLALVDDDTILSVSRIAGIITCHGNSEHPVILGERYRFGAQGFDYPTGGSGILINRAALKVLASSCSCPHADAPDDMVLGACAEQSGVMLIHVLQMHQARPPDYAPGRLANKDAITFHKHWMIDPVATYREWFEKEDMLIKSSPIKIEL